MAKRHDFKKEFYAIASYNIDSDNKLERISETYYSDKQTAIDFISKMFKRCYPNNVQVLVSEYGNNLESPKYNDHDGHLERFTTPNEFIYELSVRNFQDA